MSIFRKFFDRIYYYIDSFKAISFSAKIEKFKLDHIKQNIIVVYRIGRQKLLNSMKLTQFEKEYFEKISHYDQHRLTKFSTLQLILQDIFSENICEKEKFVIFIEENIKNEQLF